MTRRMTSLLSGLEVDSDRMSRNLDALHGVVFSQSVLLAMVDAGMVRDDAYRIVQSCAATAIETGASFRQVLAGDDRVTLSSSALDGAFDTARVLRHASRGIAALDAIQL